MKKLHRAQEALSQSDGSGTNSVKTLSASFGTKWPYKRTMSAPASMIPRQDTKQGIKTARSVEGITGLVSGLHIFIWLTIRAHEPRI